VATTLRDVAELAGVSVRTVSNVVNGYHAVRPAMREKVMAAVTSLGYSPNLAARNLRRGRTGVIGLAVPELRFSYFAELADLVLSEARRRGVEVLIDQTGGDRDREIELLRSPRMSMLDGLLFSPLGMSSDDVDELAVEYPLVLLGERIFGGPVDHVSIPNTEASTVAIEHLLATGRRRIAVIGAHRFEEIGSAALRLLGYRQAIEAAGIPFDDSLVVYMEGWHRQNGARAMEELLARNVACDAVFALNDELAFGAMRIIQQAGLRIPDDLALVGFDNVDEGEFTVPSLTTIDAGRRQISEMAVETLLNRIDGDGATAGPQQIDVKFELIIRESTGDPA
jgi:DNA-binding LacI/PurR family transcriptional regulator